MRYLKSSLALLTISLAVNGCGFGVPEFPEVYQCAYAGNPRAFYCVNTVTKAKLKLPLDDSRMKGAQCLSASDYKKSEAWTKSVIELAKTRCQ